jgi:hypothetical protein
VASHPKSLRQPGYDDVRWFADLRPRHTYETAGPDATGELHDATVAALAIAYGGRSFTVPNTAVPSLRDRAAHAFAIELPSDAEPSGDSFLLIELDDTGGVIGDWIEGSVDEAKEHGSVRASAEASGLQWEAIPQGVDPVAFVRRKLGLD